MPPSPRIENQNAGLRSPRWRTTFSGRIGAIEVDAGLRSDRNKYRRRGHPLSGSRDRIRTAQSPSWGGRGRHRAILPGADEGRHGGEQARRAQLDSLRRSGERIVELINAIRGDRDLILNPLTAQKLILPVTVVPPRIQLLRRALAIQVDRARRGLGRVRGRKLDGLQLASSSAA